MDLRIPDSLAEKAARSPESSYGATTVTLVLADARVPQVVLGWGLDVVKIGGRRMTSPSQLGFDLTAIRDVLPASG